MCVSRNGNYWVTGIFNFCNEFLFCHCSEFDDVMKVLKWPFTSVSNAPPLSTTSDDYSRLENVFVLLLKLQELYPYIQILRRVRLFCYYCFD